MFEQFCGSLFNATHTTHLYPWESLYLIEFDRCRRPGLPQSNWWAFAKPWDSLVLLCPEGDCTAAVPWTFALVCVSMSLAMCCGMHVWLLQQLSRGFPKCSLDFGLSKFVTTSTSNLFTFMTFAAIDRSTCRLWMATCKICFSCIFIRVFSLGISSWDTYFAVI